MSSAVLLGTDGHLHTGRDAGHLSRSNPERLEPNPKRRIDDDLVLLGPAEVPVRDLLAAVLGRVAEEARSIAGHLGDLTLTHPAAWGTRRRAQLVEAAEHAGLGHGRLVPEPVAAATYFAHTMLDQFAPGSRVVVYDLGAGTCDVTVLRRGPHGFDIVASDGLNDVGGLDVDAAIVAFLEAMYGRLWTDAVSRRQVWDDVRGAKEMLSRNTYNSHANTPTNTRAVNASTGNATCSMFKSNDANDTIDLSVTAVVYADTAQAVSAQKVNVDAAKSNPNVIVLTGIGEEAFAAWRSAPTSTQGAVAYTTEARDSNLRLSVLGIIRTANRQPPSDEQARQFARDLAEVARSVIAKLGNG